MVSVNFVELYLSDLGGQVANEDIGLGVGLGIDLERHVDDFAIDCRVVQLNLASKRFGLSVELRVAIGTVFLGDLVKHYNSFVNFVSALADVLEQVQVVKHFWQVSEVQRRQAVLLGGLGLLF